jgi:pyruvate-ferredoxin/flavodoxin oxidoreductase
MKNSNYVTLEGNEAAAHVAYLVNEVIAIYPITPSSPMGEFADQWSADGVKNLWGMVPRVVEMQSEGGAAGAAHGSLQAGCLTTTFTASQGLLLMIPNMYKIAGELTSTVFHVAARSVATHALSIFGDHSDVMAARTTGWAMMFSNSIQEVMDFAAIAQISTLEARIPFLHIFDGFRTSHEAQKVSKLSREDVRAFIDDRLILEHRERGLSPDNPVIRGTAQNPDVFFQAREAINPFYLAVPEITQGAMDKFAKRIGRQYHLFDYVGAPDAERVMVTMGSGCETAEETVEHLVSQGERVGLVKVRLFRPFSVKHFLAALPSSTRSIAVLDRTKEPGAIGEPLYQDIVTAVSEGMGTGAAPFAQMPRIFGGRYGLSSKEFSPAMVKGVFDEIAKDQPKNHFAVGIIDDVTNNSIDIESGFQIESSDTTRAVFWGLGSDGTVGATKNTVKIIGESTDQFAQGYFVYDSKKSGGRTVSHLRFGPRPIKSPYLIERANFVAVHQFGFLERYNTLENVEDGATLLLNSPFGPDEVWGELPRKFQQDIIDKKLRLFVIDAYRLARELKMGARINTIMQTGFFVLSGVLPRDKAVAKIKDAIKKTYGNRGEAVVKTNYAAVDAALENLHEVEVKDGATGREVTMSVVSDDMPEFVREVTARVIADEGDLLPVSAMPVDGTFPTGTTKWEKRRIALEVPVWDSDVCIQCGKCVIVCPHTTIRAKVYDEKHLGNAPASFKSTAARWREFPDKKYTLQVAVEDCTGCTLCVEVCPAKDKSNVGHKAINMAPITELIEQEQVNWDFFLGLPDIPRTGNGDGLSFNKVKNVQLLEPLFEFSGACAGCGETPYLRLLSQLFGDRSLIANATGCSSIYGGNLPTTPWAKNRDGRGPSWSNSLFEDNAEFGLGMRLAVDKQREYAKDLVKQMRDEIGPELADSLLQSEQINEKDMAEQRERVAALKKLLKSREDTLSRDLASVSDKLVRKCVWIVGGDGWGYDIGYGGLDHVLASGHNVNVLVLDTEVYSNTGGQASKSTPMGAVAKFASGGKTTPRKDLGLLAMDYQHVYVAQIAIGASDGHTIKAFQEAASYEGPSLIIAYSHCIAHGIDMAKGMSQQKLAVDCGHWPLYRYDPRRRLEGQNPFQLDSKRPKTPLQDYRYNENRYRVLQRTHPKVAAHLLGLSQDLIEERWARYERMAKKAEKEE